MLSFTNEPGMVVVAFKGRMDTATSMAVENEVFDHVQMAGEPAAFDLAGVEFVSSAFFRLCLKAARATPDKTIEIRNATAEVKKGFMLTKLDSIMKIK